jgi:hypothetical protein
MPATYEPIAATTLGSAAATISINSIPGTYTDLRLVLVAEGTSGQNTDLIFTFNSDTATNYSQTELNGDGATASTRRYTSRANFWAENSRTLDWPSLTTLDVFSYAGSTNKSILMTVNKDNNAINLGVVRQTIVLWRNTSAITSIQISSNTANFEIGTTATLYGIKNA